jgi:hypothetical protein
VKRAAISDYIEPSGAEEVGKTSSSDTLLKGSQAQQGLFGYFRCNEER